MTNTEPSTYVGAASNLRTIPVPEAKGGDTYDGIVRGDGDGPCYICGRHIKVAKHWVHAVDGGDRLLHRDDEDAYEADGGDLGHHPVGSDCARLIPAEYRTKGGA